MNILLLGSGGREHALAWKLTQSKLCSQLFIAPGNPGTATCGTNLPFTPNNFRAVKDCCAEKNISLVLIGPEEPLVNGLVDYLKKEAAANLLIIGPSQQAAKLEGSKAFAKDFMRRHNIPTASYREFSHHNFKEGVEYLHQHTLPIVLKADGLAAGKGVLICNSHMEAVEEFEEMIENSKFGEASKRVVVEEFLDGIELSVFALTDGKNYILLPEAKDYKRIGEGDTGLNTGGMGAISPVPFADKAFMQKVTTQIIEPTIRGIKKDNLDYKGFVFFGLIKVGGEPFVIEYNCRMGDPETEVVIPRIKSDLVDLLLATAEGKLEGKVIEQEERSAATIMAVSGGYPEAYEKSFPISGLDQPLHKDTLVFHAGTTQINGEILTAGGRVLCVTTLADDLQTALQKSKAALENIQFEGKYFRSDIGYEFK